MTNFLNEIPDLELFLEGDRSAMEILEAVKESYRDGNILETEHYRGKVITTPFEFHRLVNRILKLEEFAFDTEFTSLRMMAKNPDFEFVSCSFSWGKFQNYSIPVGHWVNEDYNIPLNIFRAGMKRIFERKNYRLIGHNLKAEFHALAQIDIEIHTDDLYDTLVAMWNLNENEEVGLKAITKREYGYNQTDFKRLLGTIPKHVQKEFGVSKPSERNIAMVHPIISSFYAMDDTYWTWCIYLDSLPLMEEDGIENFFFKRQMPYLRVLFIMERRGIRVDHERLRAMEDLARKELDNLEYEIFELAGVKFSITSGQQLAEIIYGWEKMKPIYEQIAIPILDADGNQEYYKSGPRKGQPKVKYKNTDKITSYEYSGNRELVDASFKFKVSAQTPTGMPKTGDDELSKIAASNYRRNKRKQEGVEMVRLIMRYKRLEKLRSTYMSGLANQTYPDGRIHCSFNQTGTTSGRLSCSGPNLQQLPRPIEYVSDTPPKKEDYDNINDFEKALDTWKFEYPEYVFWKQFEIRDAFLADNGKTLIASDYANLEMRILAHFSQDPLLLNMFSTGVDAHGDTAKNMFKLDCTVKEVKKLYPHLRQQAKTINFLLVYGGSAMALANSLGVSKQEGQELYDLYFDTYKGVKKYVKTMKNRAHRDGYVQTILGRKRHLQDDIWSGNYGKVGYAERLAINAPIQGSGADIAVSAQIDIENDPILKELGYEQLLQVHDEVVGQVPDENAEAAMKRVQYLMANCLPQPMNGIELRADADTGRTYSEAK